MDPLFEIRIELDRCGSSGIVAVLASQLRKAIAEGRLPVGTKLPPTRRAKAAFGISRNTLATAYERLVADGHLVSRRGSGIYVADKFADRGLHFPESKLVRKLGFELNQFWSQPDVASETGFWAGSDDIIEAAIDIDFRPALVDSRLFPHDIFRRISAKELRAFEVSPPRLKSALSDRGSEPLQMAIAAHLAAARAIACHPDHIVITSGAQQAFELLARALVTAGKTVVAVEDPGYPAMRVPFRGAGAKIAPVGVDDEGLKVAELPEETKVICVCPSHQFPLGVTMSPRRRAALHAFARKNAAVIVEDDYDGEFRFDGLPVDALWSADRAEHVFYVGTFSKCMLPAFRLGYVIAPDWALDTITLIKNSTEGHCSIPVQRGVASFIDEGHLMRHVRKSRTTYRKRRDLVMELLERDFAQWLDPLKSSYGMHLAALSKTSINLENVAQTVRGEGVAIHTLDRYFLGKRTVNGLVFGVGVTDETDIESGLAILRRALERESLVAWSGWTRLRA